MDLMPVSDQSEHKQYKGNHEQSGGLRGIDRVAMVTMLGFLFGLWRQHAPIVSPPVALWPQMATSITRMHADQTYENLSRESAKSARIRGEEVAAVLNYGVVHGSAAEQRQNRSVRSV